MLKPSQLQDLSIIAQLACSCLVDWGYNFDFLLVKSIAWDETQESWIVGIIDNYRVPKEIHVAIQPYGISYRYRRIVRQ